MEKADSATWTAGEVVLSCESLDATLRFFEQELGFVIESIMPADDPVVAILSGAGLRVRLELRSVDASRGAAATPADGSAATAGVLRLHGGHLAANGGKPRVLIAPNGTRIDLVPTEPELVLPPMRASCVLTRHDDGNSRGAWKRGRAGMEYRDLIPGRQGGRYIASHIRIRDGGPVPDYVHFHRIHFQVIHCVRGWVRVVYEDQGEPLLLQAGDCILQPPRIRHRVLECSPMLEVVEVTCPAEHETCADHGLELPNPGRRARPDFDGQRFLCHRTAEAPWQASWRPGLVAADTGVAEATGGLAGVRIMRAAGGRLGALAPGGLLRSHDAEFVFAFVLAGSATLRISDRGIGAHAGRVDHPVVSADFAGVPDAADLVGAADAVDVTDSHGEHAASPVRAGDAFVVPAGIPHALASFSEDFELFEVSLPGAFRTGACT